MDYLQNLNEEEGFSIYLKYSFQREYDSSFQYYGIEAQKINSGNIIKILKFLKGEIHDNYIFYILSYKNKVIFIHSLLI